MSLSVEAVDIKKRIESCKNLQEVEDIRLEYLGKKGLILATDISGKSLMNIKNTKNVLTKKIAMENLPKYLSKLDLRFEKFK